MKHIAEKLGCSVTTVSRVLNGKGDQYRISKKTQQLILQTADEMNFTINHLARGLRLQKSMAIGLVIPDISNPFFSTIARYVEREARKNGYSIILCDTEEDTDLEIHSLKMLQIRQVDGLIISTVGQTAEHLLRIFSNNMPMVILDRVFPGTGIPFVASDNYQGAFNAVEHLIRNGHRSIACIQGLPNTFPNDERIRGYIHAHKKYALPVDSSLIVGDSYGKQNGYMEMKLLLHKENRPTALFACSNLISLGALQAILEEKLQVPNDISIISFDDQPYSNYLATPMTTVMQQTEEMGSIAVRMLLDQLNTDVSYPSKEPSKEIFLSTSLIIRDSVRNITNIGAV